jgi:uncharacterized coiled-coil DUF342 family protein
MNSKEEFETEIKAKIKAINDKIYALSNDTGKAVKASLNLLNELDKLKKKANQ